MIILNFFYYQIFFLEKTLKKTKYIFLQVKNANNNLMF